MVAVLPSQPKTMCGTRREAFDLKPVLSGVPQGSQIDPLLYILYIYIYIYIYIYDLTNHVDSCKISLRR